MTIAQLINTTRTAITTITKITIGINCQSGGDQTPVSKSKKFVKSKIRSHQGETEDETMDELSDHRSWLMTLHPLPRSKVCPKKSHRAIPRQRGGRLIVARRRIVVKTVECAFEHVHLVSDPMRLEGRFVLRILS